MKHRKFRKRVWQTIHRLSPRSPQLAHMLILLGIFYARPVYGQEPPQPVGFLTLDVVQTGIRPLTTCPPEACCGRPCRSTWRGTEEQTMTEQKIGYIKIHDNAGDAGGMWTVTGTLSDGHSPPIEKIGFGFTEEAAIQKTQELLLAEAQQRGLTPQIVP